MGVSPAWIEVDASHLCNPPILGMWMAGKTAESGCPRKRGESEGKVRCLRTEEPHPAKRLLFPTSQMPKDTR